MAFQRAIEDLESGKTTLIRPRGKSMEPLVHDGEEVLLIPVKDKRKLFPGRKPVELSIGDVVLVKVKGSVYLHKITAIDGDRVQIGNNRGRINGWTGMHKVYGAKA